VKIFLSTLMAIIVLLISNVDKTSAQTEKCIKNHYFPHLNRLKETPGLTFKKIPAYQQSTDYTCGPATLLTLANYYWPDQYPMAEEKEMKIADEAGTRDLTHDLPGTNPIEMLNWLQNHGFKATLTFETDGDGTALSALQEHIENGTPVIVEWSDWGGHWVIAVGYDTRNTEDLTDDVIIFADPYDHHDNVADGYSFFNAVRFYWMWYDALYFGELTWRTMIVATPVTPP
jgi:hypothetical protein